MARTFRSLTVTQFKALVAQYPFKNSITEVHMHHTWRPDHADAKGRAKQAVEAMYRYHTEVNKWSDIAQHVTIDADGIIWLGRNWNLPPASATGHNGKSGAHPFMFEMIGDFDQGKDKFGGKQAQAAYAVIAAVQLANGLRPEALKFHNEMSGKSCPGNAIRKADVLSQVRMLHTAAGHASVNREIDMDDLARLATELSSGPAKKRSLAPDAPEEDGEHGRMSEAFLKEIGFTVPTVVASEGVRGAVVREANDETPISLDPAARVELRRHVVNLRFGKLSKDGIMKTDPGDIEAIFKVHLPEFFNAMPQVPPRIVLFAHGGLVNEKTGLEIAARQIRWWLENGVYPIFFVWETGFLDSLGGAILSRVTGRRDLADHTTDPAIELAVRTFGGIHIWQAMKVNAEKAFEEGGGGLAFLEELLAFSRLQQGIEEERPLRNPEPLQMHAVGHSAGSIFHAHLLRMAAEMGIPNFQSLQFLAPAIEVGEFQSLLGPLLRGKENYTGALTMYTMFEEFERNDNCLGAYRKSLLYLIRHALNPDKPSAILGLEECIKEDEELLEQFGIAGRGGSAGEIVFSVSPRGPVGSQSAAIAHGCFDEDRPTMESVGFRVLGRAPTPFPGSRCDGKRGLTPPPDGFGGPAAAVMTTSRDPGGASGNRKAVCVGINAYPGRNELFGCVADAEAWAQALTSLHFETALLLDQEATRENLLDTMGNVLDSASAGDVIVFQFAGHGTQVPDDDGDEEVGQDDDGLVGDANGQMDEAFVPIDFESGGLLIDDDLNALFARVPKGVSLTCFFDTCHSDTVTRVASFGAPEKVGRPRFMRATEALIQAHRAFRATHRPLASRPNPHRAVLFSACRAAETAQEVNGRGVFSSRAIPLLREGISHRAFRDEVAQLFPVSGGQMPQLDCAIEEEPAILFAGTARASEPGPAPAKPTNDMDLTSVAHLLRAVADRLE